MDAIIIIISLLLGGVVFYGALRKKNLTQKAQTKTPHTPIDSNKKETYEPPSQDVIKINCPVVNSASEIHIDDDFNHAEVVNIVSKDRKLPEWIFYDGIKRLELDLIINYAPYGKELSERKITTAFYNSDKGLIYAFCHKEKMHLTFSKKKIEWMIHDNLTIEYKKVTRYLNSKSNKAGLLSAEPDFKYHADDNITVSCTLNIQLKGSEYKYKERVVKVCIYNHVSEIIYGECLTSNEYRIFHLKSIVNCLSDSGENITTKVRSYLRKHQVK